MLPRTPSWSHGRGKHHSSYSLRVNEHANTSPTPAKSPWHSSSCKGRWRFCPVLVQVCVSNLVMVIRATHELIIIILLISAVLLIRSSANMCKQRSMLPGEWIWITDMVRSAFLQCFTSQSHLPYREVHATCSLFDPPRCSFTPALAHRDHGSAVCTASHFRTYSGQ